MGGGIASVMRGAGSGVTGTRNVALGTGDGTVAYDATLSASAGNLVTGSDNVAIGTNAGIGVAVNNTTSIGHNAQASQTNGAAIGFQAIASGVNSIYLGARTGPATGALAGSAIAIGTDVTASQTDSTAIGRQSKATGTSAAAVGTASQATATSAACTAGSCGCAPALAWQWPKAPATDEASPPWKEKYRSVASPSRTSRKMGHARRAALVDAPNSSE